MSIPVLGACTTVKFMTVAFLRDQMIIFILFVFCLIPRLNDSTIKFTSVYCVLCRV